MKKAMSWSLPVLIWCIWPVFGPVLRNSWEIFVLYHQLNTPRHKYRPSASSSVEVLHKVASGDETRGPKFKRSQSDLFWAAISTGWGTWGTMKTLYFAWLVCAVVIVGACLAILGTTPKINPHNAAVEAEVDVEPTNAIVDPRLSLCFHLTASSPGIHSEGTDSSPGTHSEDAARPPEGTDKNKGGGRDSIARGSGP